MEIPCRITVDTSRLFTLADLAMRPADAQSEEAEPMPESDDAFDDLDEDADAFYSPVPRRKEQLLSFPARDAWIEEEPAEAPEKELNTSFQTFGTVSKTNDGSLSVCYDDTDLTGLEGCRTTFRLTPEGRLVLLRSGPSETCMVFEKEKRHLCDYGNLPGLGSLVLHTHALSADLTENGGRICVEYTVEIGGARSEENRLVLRFEKQ